MRTILVIWALLVSAGQALRVCGAAAARSEDGVVSFSHLPGSDSLQIRFTSGGCFHFYTLDLTFWLTNPATVSLAQVRPAFDERTRSCHDVEKTDLGTLSLTPADVAGLDLLFDFYRSVPAGGCTTKNKIEISQVRGGVVIACEVFDDATCDAERIPGVVTISQLVRRLPRPEAKR